jgi:hypothetical protein
MQIAGARFEYHTYGGTVTIRKPDKFSFWMVDTGLKTGPVIKW